MPDQSPETTDEQPATSPFPFARLPPEIQLLVLEAALPSPRIFHVSGERRARGRSLTFHVRHAPPVALSVCRAARTGVLRRGLFLDGAHGAFFLPAVDVLYFDRSHRRQLQTPPAFADEDEDGAWAAVVQHVAVEWRALFARTPRGRQSAGWRAALAGLRARMPALRTVTYALPPVRHPGGLTWGREPYGAQRHRPRLVPLPEETRVPWGDSLVMHELPPPHARLPLEELLADARKSYLVPWGQMKRMIDEARGGEEAAGEKQHGGDWRELELRGCWLLRADAVYAEDVTSFWR